MRKKAILIGVNDYPLLGNLKYAEADANDFAQSLKNYYGFTEDEIVLMTSEKRGIRNPQKSIIETCLDNLLQTSQNLDLFLFGFWGHGFLSGNQDRYLCVSGTNVNQLSATALSFQVICGKIKQLCAQNTCLILDCCQELHGRGQSTFTDTEDKKYSEAAATMARDILVTRRERGMSVIVPPSFAILNSCSSNQKAYEWNDRQHGIFTAYLLEGMSNRIGSLSGLAGYASKRVPGKSLELYNIVQTPFFKLEGSGDIRLDFTPEKTEIPVPPPFKVETIWYVHTSDGDMNYTEKVLIESIRADKISQTAHLWTAGMTDWAPITNFPQFRDLFPSKPASSSESSPVTDVSHPPVFPTSFLKWDNFKSIDITRGEFETLQEWEDRINSYNRIQLGECTLTRYNVDEKKYRGEIKIDERVAKKLDVPFSDCSMDLPMDRDFAKQVRGKVWPLTTKLSVSSNRVQLKYPQVEISDQKYPVQLTPAAGSPLVITHNGVDYRFRWCPAGEFMMGSPTTEEDRGDNETQHKVRLTKGFWMLETPVTQRMWESVMGKNPSKFKGDQLPVECVSWEDSQSFISKLNGACLMSGYKFSLPTEAQWEYACRAGTTTPYHFGSSLNGDKANCDGRYPYGTNTKGRYLRKTTKVGSYEANAWGLYDMHGNVWEWCLDWYDVNYYKTSPIEDPLCSNSGSSRVVRGGCWHGLARYCRSAFRGGSDPSNRSGDLGLRLTLVPPGE